MREGGWDSDFQTTRWEVSLMARCLEAMKSGRTRCHEGFWMPPLPQDWRKVGPRKHNFESIPLKSRILEAKIARTLPELGASWCQEGFWMPTWQDWPKLGPWKQNLQRIPTKSRILETKIARTLAELGV